MPAWLHTLSPFAIRFGDGFGLRWYGLAYALGFFAGWALLRWLARRGCSRIPEHRAADAVISIAIGAIVGGRLGYAVFYRPELFWSFTPDLPWWELLAVHQGGMASHGGMIGVIVAAWRVSLGWKDESGAGERIGRAPLLHATDMLALATPPGLLLGRLANFVNGELLGRVVSAPGEPAPWWGVKFPHERLEGDAPTLTFEQQQRLHDLVERVRLPMDGYDQGYERLVREIQAGSSSLAGELEPLLAARYPSQLAQGLAEGVVLGIVLWLVARSPRRAGVVSAWFLIAYGVLRVATEVWRLPDAHLAVGRPLGLSRGQWLSVAMAGVGVGLLVWIRRRAGPMMVGWAK